MAILRELAKTLVLDLFCAEEKKTADIDQGGAFVLAIREEQHLRVNGELASRPRHNQRSLTF
jgi:hypothetical protein